ncbi:hypothetical protein PybrP1_011821 [[Pythium] brassicae (nom. inval.)]|nr:hypothetical protein PybrP1_011821 [[Pythium] brassicae (nom. inval.)]
MEQLRAEGNALVSAKQYEAAIAKYSEGLALPADGSQDAATAQRVLLWSNRAMCHLQLEQFEAAAADCSAALAVDPGNEKARYRRAQAHVGLGRFAQAFTDVRMVLQLNPTNKAAVALARKIKDAVQDDVHGLQKALDAVVGGVDGGARVLVGQQPKTEEALKFLEMKCFSDLAAVPRELEAKGGLIVLWRVVKQLLEMHSDAVNDEATQRSVLAVLSGVIGLLAVVASASVELAALVYQRSGPSVFHLVIELLHAQVALEYSSERAAYALMPLVGRKAIVKLCAFVFKHLMLTSDDDPEVRRVLNGILDGLRSQELELQISALDGVLHFLSTLALSAGAGAASTSPSGQPNTDALKLKTQHFANLAHELGVFSLFHTKAASALHADADAAVSQAAKGVLLSRLPLVFTQCLSQFEGNDALLKKLVREYCVAPVLAASARDRTQLELASASCLLLSALFLSNAKLALWAVQQTGNDGTLFLARVNDFLAASRTFVDKREHTRQFQEVWVDCVASVCGVENGTACVPPVLRVEIIKMLHSALENEDLVLKASALSIQVKLGVVEKTLELESADGQLVLDGIFDVLEHAHAFESRTAGRQLFWSGASPKERGVEALSYVITTTSVKNAFVRRPRAVTSVFQVDFPTAKASASDHHAHVGYRSNVYYGIGYILHHVLTSEAALKKKQMDGMEMSAEQYEELQKALKQKSALEDGDSPEQVHTRVKLLLQSRDVLATLVQLLKYSTTKSQNVVEMAVLSALHAAEVAEFRGSLVQSGVLQSLLPLSLHALSSGSASGTKAKKPQATKPLGTKISNAAGQAIAKILISTNPNLLPSSSLLSCIRPLLDLCKGETQLLQFEALMALTNIASVSDETKNRIMAEPQGLATLQYLQFSEHELVRRAATEAICNLLPNDEVIEKVFMNEEKLRLWLAFASVEEEEEDFETARAAGGALAMVSQVPQVSWRLMKHGGLQTFSRVIESSKHDESLHRAFFALENMLEALKSGGDGTSSRESESESGAATKAQEKQEFLEELKTHRPSLVTRLKQLLPKSGVPSTPVNDAAQSLLGSLLKVEG